MMDLAKTMKATKKQGPEVDRYETLHLANACLRVRGPGT